MAGLWDGLPASPCSAASDEAPVRKTRQSVAYVNATRIAKPPQAISPVSDVHFALPKRTKSIAANSTMDDSLEGQPAFKRSRSEPMESIDAMNVDVSMKPSGAIEFAEARESNTESNSDFVARLNFSAADERRKMLLQRLRAIDAKKAEIAAKRSQLTPPKSEVIVLDDTSSPSDVQEISGTKPPPPRARNSRKRPARPTKRKKPAKNTAPAVADNAVIDVDAESSSTVKSGRKVAAKQPSQASTLSSDSAVPKRTSSRVRRPRLPNADADCDEAKPSPTPVCMSKCKRFQFCKKLITSMLRNSSAGPFSAPVSQLWAPEAIPRYFDVITRPMDLGTVKKNLETSVYITSIQGDMLPYRFEVEKFATDVRQVFRNAMVYNRAGDMLYNCAKALLDEFDKTLESQLPALPTPEEVASSLTKKRSTGRKGRKEKTNVGSPGGTNESSSPSPKTNIGGTGVALATAKGTVQDSWTAAVTRRAPSPLSDELYESEKDMRDRLRYLKRCRPAVLARSPVPKGEGYLSRAAILYDVEISYQEKVRCSNAIEQGKVPSSKLEGLVDLVRKSTGDTSGAAPEDEFEFEFDKLDNKAWRNIEAFLEQYVPGFKTIRSSVLGREFSSVSDVDEEIRLIQQKLSELSSAPSKEKRRDEAVVNKPRSFFGDGDVDESSSDSSDGESDSDSSDSDSDDE